jgi:hypothetical protein
LVDEPVAAAGAVVACFAPLAGTADPRLNSALALLCSLQVPGTTPVVLAGAEFEGDLYKLL